MIGKNGYQMKNKLVIGDHIKIIWRYYPNIYECYNVSIIVCIIGPFCEVNLYD